MKKFSRIFMVCLSLFSIFGLLLTKPATLPAAASAGPAPIAYVITNSNTGDEIRLIDPDGANDRLLWHSGEKRENTLPEVDELTWKPDASELAFTSSFQEACSVYSNDIYAIRNDGAGMRRLTAPPACGANPGLLTGNVQLNVVNYTDMSTTFIVYVEGAPGPQSISLNGYLDSGTVFFTNVIDYGAGVPQWESGAWGYHRYSYVSSHVDVIPGKTVTGELDLMQFDRYWANPTYNSDGSQIAFLLNPNQLYYAPSNNTTPGGVGSKLINPSSMPLSPSHFQWGRGAHAHHLLYQGYNTDVWPYQYEYYLVDEGSTTSGVLQTATELSLGLTWLPDGSGFLYSAGQQDPDTFARYGNVFEYNFATQTSKQLSNFTTGYTREITVSPDGQQIVFEYQEGDWTDTSQPISLWMMNRDGSNARLFVANAHSPAWSPSALPSLPPIPPAPVSYKVYLPDLVK